MRTLILIGLFSLADRPPAPGALPEPPEPLRAGFAAIEEADLRAWIEFLSSPELEGRETARRGYDVAARFCAVLFARYGLKPAGDGGTYFQKFEVIRTEADPDLSRLEVRDGAGEERFGLDGLALASAGELEWSGGWVFAGYGEGADQDAPDDFRGLPVADRVVMVLPRPGRNKFESRGAASAGARRIAVISDERVKQRMGLEERERPAFLSESSSSKSKPEIVYLTRRVADRILRSRNLTVEGLLSFSSGGGSPERLPRFELEGVEVRLSLKRKRSVLPARNLVGILEGSDPALQSQAVAIGAHLDHVGARDGKVYQGADDDASGSSGVLALARAFAESPRRPARSVLFLLFAGEEKGLWGSRYFVDHPPIQLERVTAYIQLDMIGRNEEHPQANEGPEENLNSLHLVGSERLSLDLHRAIVSANRYTGLDFEYDEEGVYRRSDQLSFAERGIPVAFFFTGFHPDYHQPSDTADKINYPKLARVLRLVFISAFELADRPAPLRRAGRL